MGLDLREDVPVLSAAQFSALHMALSMNDFNCIIVVEDELGKWLSDGYCVLSKCGETLGMYKAGDYILLAEPIEEEQFPHQWGEIEVLANNLVQSCTKCNAYRSTTNGYGYLPYVKEGREPSPGQWVLGEDVSSVCEA